MPTIRTNKRYDAGILEHRLVSYSVHRGCYQSVFNPKKTVLEYNSAQDLINRTFGG